MRITAGILLIVLGMVLLISFVYVLIDYGGYDLAIDLFAIIASVFIVTGGVFCLMRKVWGLCFASALVVILFMLFWLIGSRLAETWLTWLISIVGTLPIIFVCVRKREWQESQVRNT